MTDDERQRVLDCIERAKLIVASWPSWKRGIIEQSMKSTVDVSRVPVINPPLPDDYDDW